MEEPWCQIKKSGKSTDIQIKSPMWFLQASAVELYYATEEKENCY